MKDIPQGVAVVTFTARTLLTDEAVPLYIPSVDVIVRHRDLHIPRHDAKPFKLAVGVDSIAEAQAIAEQRLAVAASDIMLQAIMTFLSTI